MKKSSGFIRSAISAIIIVICVCSAALSDSIKFYKVISAEAPTLDGKFTDSCWQKTSWETGFIETITGTGPASIQTRFAAVMDSKNLYIAVVCQEPEMNKLVCRITEPDGNLWEDDCIEIVFDTEGSDFMKHLITNSNGVKYDSDQAAGGAGWNPNWQVQTTKEVDKWSIEAKIPFASLRVNPAKLDTWRANICRERQAGKRQLSSWNDAKGNFQTPQTFGCFIFGSFSNRVKQTILPEWNQITSQVSQFRNSGKKEELEIVEKYNEIAQIVDPVIKDINSQSDITQAQYLVIYNTAQSSFPQLHEMLNVGEINKLLEEGTK